MAVGRHEPDDRATIRDTLVELVAVVDRRVVEQDAGALATTRVDVVELRTDACPSTMPGLWEHKRRKASEAGEACKASEAAAAREACSQTRLTSIGLRRRPRQSRNTSVVTWRKKSLLKVPGVKAQSRKPCSRGASCEYAHTDVERQLATLKALCFGAEGAVFELSLKVE